MCDKGGDPVVRETSTVLEIIIREVFHLKRRMLVEGLDLNRSSEHFFFPLLLGIKQSKWIHIYADRRGGHFCKRAVLFLMKDR